MPSATLLRCRPSEEAEVIATTKALRYTADGLTIGRLLLAPVLAVASFAGAWTITSILVSAAWISDLLDGKAARRSGEATVMASCDIAVDTTVGAALVVGIVGGSHAPWPWAVAAGLFAAVYALTGVATYGMLTQAVGYGLALWEAYHASRPGFALMVSTVIALAILGRRRLIEFVLPTFFAGFRRSDTSRPR